MLDPLPPFQQECNNEEALDESGNCVPQCGIGEVLDESGNCVPQCGIGEVLDESGNCQVSDGLPIVNEATQKQSEAEEAAKEAEEAEGSRRGLLRKQKRCSKWKCR